VKANPSSDYEQDEHSLHQGEWGWHSYIQKGVRSGLFATHCPKTVEMLEDIPLFMTGEKRKQHNK